MTQIWKKWTPAVGAVAAIATAAFVGPVVGPVIANTSADLPDKTPAQVLELAAGHNVDTLSGTIEQTSDLGLPDLSLSGPNGQGPTSDTSGSSGGSDSPEGSSSVSPESAALEMLTESHTVRVFFDGPEHARVQLQDQFAERNLIRNGNDVWYYDSEENRATHAVVPAGHKHAKSTEGQGASNGEMDRMPGGVPAPGQLAEKFLDKVDSSTKVTVGADKMVAGRAAYDLTLTPKTSETLVGSISIAVDGETGLPLSVTVTARGETSPAFSVAFSEISLQAPDASLFEFTPPEGATVTEIQDLHHDAGKRGQLHDGDQPHNGGDDQAKPKLERPENKDQPKPTVTGAGWGTVLELPGRSDLQGMNPEMVNQLSTPVDGGRLLQTKLVNVLLTDDGRTLVGAVTAERLQSVAAGQ